MLLKILKKGKGFTLIELMIVITIIGILASIAVPEYKWGVRKAREAVLSETLWTFRSTIDQYFADQGKYPDSLQELVDKNYLRGIPKDPFTNATDTWQTIPPQSTPETGEVKGGVYDVHSGSNLVGSNGTPYNEW